MEIAEDFKLIELHNVKENAYYISTKGEVFSVYLNDIMRHKEDKDGYYELSLCTREKNKRNIWKVHRLVAKVYLGEPPEYMKDPTVDHIDGDKTNNDYVNLRWVERDVNSSIRKNKGIGESNHEAILNEKQVIEICELLIQNTKTFKEIADMYSVDKSTISNIKRKKTWKHLTKAYAFEIKKQKNKNESIKQREEIFELLNSGTPRKDIVKMGYPSTVVYRCDSLLKDSYFIVS